jgi:hypothetical protein
LSKLFEETLFKCLWQGPQFLSSPERRDPAQCCVRIPNIPGNPVSIRSLRGVNGTPRSGEAVQNDVARIGGQKYGALWNLHR